MTTTPVTSITDEQLAEIEYSLRPIGFNSYNDNIRGLITRLRAAEKDAESLRDAASKVCAIIDGDIRTEVRDSIIMASAGNMNIISGLNEIYGYCDAIDRALQEQPK